MLFRRDLLTRLIGMVFGSALPIQSADGQSVGQVRCIASGRGLRIEGTGEGYTISSGTLLPGNTYNLTLDGSELRIG